MIALAMFSFLVVLFFSPWIWEVYSQNILVFFVLVLASFALYKGKQFLFILLSIVLFFSFFKTTQKTPLGFLTPVENAVQTKRLNSYPPLPVTKLPYWLEQREETLTVYKLQKNLTNFFDINYYFFGSYPREQQTPGEFVKFPFVYLPLALIGSFVAIKGKHGRKVIIYIVVSAFLVSVIGDKNHKGLYINFPLLAVATTIGLKKTLNEDK